MPKKVSKYDEPKEDLEKRPAKAETVAVGDLAVMQLFSYKGGVYSKRKTGPGGVKAISKAGDELVTLDPDTRVSPAQ